MFKIYYKNCAGIDVHKKHITVRIAKTDNNGITTYQIKTFSTFTEDLIKCKNWLVDNGTLDVCMESTGKYWIPVWNILESECRCVLTHPKYVKSKKGKKTDNMDALNIADMFRCGLVEPSFIPPKDIRNLRELMRYRRKLINFKSSEKNRFQNSLTVSNIQISNIVSDVFGKTTQSILKLMLENDHIILDDIKPLLRKNLKSSPEEILKSIDGNFDEIQSSKITVCLDHYNSIISCIDTLEEAIMKLAINYQTELKLLLTIPGIKDFSALCIIAEIGTDMNVFCDEKNLISWAGLSPRCKESAGKKQSVRINKAGAYIKPILVQCALCAIKDKSCPYIKARYESIKRRRGHKKAIIAIARFLLKSAYHVLNKKESFALESFDNLLNKNYKSAKILKSKPDEMISYLETLGYEISLKNT